MLLTYITIGYLLSALGFLIYRGLVQQKSSPLQRRQFIYTLIVLSLLLPATVLYYLPNLSFSETLRTQLIHSHQQLIPETEIQSCYKQALHAGTDFCQCEELQQTNILIYKADSIYDILIKIRVGFLWCVAAIMMFILTGLFLRMLYLARLVRHSRREVRIIDGKPYHILHDQSTFLAASFRLWRRYIIWQQQLNVLPQEEQHAVLLHEIAHIRNRDTWQYIALNLLQLLWFLNPIFYLLRKELKLINEYLADAYVVNHMHDPCAYASLLIKLKERQNADYIQHFGGSSLSKRILQIIEPVKSTRRYFIPMMVGLAIILFSTSFVLTPPLHKQTYDFEKYQLLQSEHYKTGKNSFCRNCLYEQLEEDCLLE